MINIVIPIAGKAQRFIDAGFTAPKPLIMVQDKHMIDWAMDSIDYAGHRLIFVVRQDHVTNFSIDRILKKKFGEDTVVIAVDHVTRGTLCTCLLASEFINNNDPLVIYTPDVCFAKKFDPRSALDTGLDGLLLTFKANNPAHSYAALDENELVIETAEKRVISEHAAVGVYYFRRGKDFVRFGEHMIENEMTTNGEFYVCPIYNLLIGESMLVGISKVDKMHVLGTPSDVKFFMKRVVQRFGTKPVALCADHSGFDLKQKVIERLEQRGIEYVDFGTYVQTDCDHHDFLSQAVRHINDHVCDFGMAFCRTGQGFNIAANKALNIRSALVFDSFTASHAIRHNAANFFCVPSHYVATDQTIDSILTALADSSFDGGRHTTRVRRIEDDIELFHS